MSATTGTVVNGGTGSYALEASLVAFALIAAPLLLAGLSSLRAWARDRQAHRADRAAMQARARLQVVRSPDRCRVCSGVGWHTQGCGRLDRLDAGMRW